MPQFGRRTNRAGVSLPAHIRDHGWLVGKVEDACGDVAAHEWARSHGARVIFKMSGFTPY